jgi:hypothetical protein
MLNFNENKVTYIFLPITGTLIFILFMPNYQSYICVFFLLHFSSL